MGFVDVISLDELKKSKRKTINVNNQEITLFYLDGTVYAINSVCPHKGGPLGEGDLDGEEVVCPWHAFMFNVKTGQCLNHPGMSVKNYKIKVEGDKVKLSVD